MVIVKLRNGAFCVHHVSAICIPKYITGASYLDSISRRITVFEFQSPSGAIQRGLHLFVLGRNNAIAHHLLDPNMIVCHRPAPWDARVIERLNPRGCKFYSIAVSSRSG